MNRVQNTKLVLWLITGLAAATGLHRFIFGLGTTTNLTDSTPWGFWIGFDVMAGVALAGGGFVITAIFYMMKREEFHHLVKPAVLTAFLGYLAVVFGLLFDLGLPWNIWHMIIYWNPHSPLFEVGWCVMLYSAVLLLEFSPVPLEKFSRYAKIRTFLMKYRFILVLLGIMLSTLHQSSLGSLFLIMPFKLHGLWYSDILPIQFFISAVALGLMMVSFESMVSHWLYKRPPETKLVAKLARAAVWVLGIYFAVKMIDIIVAGEFNLILAGTWESWLFVAEMLISIIIPIVIFSISSLRKRSGWLTFGSFLVVFGMIFNRINVGGFTMLRATGDNYIPSWTEITISLGVVSTAALVFLFVIEKFNIWDTRPQHPESLPHAQPNFDYSSRVWLGNPRIAALTKYSMAFILSFALGTAIIPYSHLHSKGVESIAVNKARGDILLYIDGNRDGHGIMFDHQRHIDSLNFNDSCSFCHHMNMPLDKNTGCWQCHEYMYSTSSVFNHDWHGSAEGANISCDKCHPQNEVRIKETAKPCADCHKDMIAFPQERPFENLITVSYTDALHSQCISCHKERAGLKETTAKLAECASCHETIPPEQMQDLLQWHDEKPSYNQVVLPLKDTNVTE
jgi:Ni/Fe-hydrogenase subunit HybB-like protein